MPYDLFTNLHTTEGEYAWIWSGTYPKLWLAHVERDRLGQQQPELRRWLLFYYRRTTGHGSTLHSQGAYPPQEGPNG